MIEDGAISSLGRHLNGHLQYTITLLAKERISFHNLAEFVPVCDQRGQIDAMVQNHLNQSAHPLFTPGQSVVTIL